MRLVFLGPPGAGKGTQATRFAEGRGIPLISTGEILRQAIRLATPTGLTAKKYVDSGELVPFEIILQLVRDRLQDSDAAAGWVLDGFPRNLAQAEAFATLLGELGVELDRVVYIEVSEEAVVQRLSGRRVCKGCGHTYHVEFSPPSAEGVCDECQGEVHQRSDDTREAIVNRLQVYGTETDPLVAYYQERGQLLTIAGGRAIKEVAASLGQGRGG